MCITYIHTYIHTYINVAIIKQETLVDNIHTIAYIMAIFILLTTQARYTYTYVGEHGAWCVVYSVQHITCTVCTR